MDQKEKEWLEKKIGVISASKLDSLESKSGKWIGGNLTYLYSLERQRFLKQPAPPIHSRAMEIGIENEPLAVAWMRENTSMCIKHCDVDYPEKIFIITDWGLGCSPDVYEINDLTEDIISLIEIKCKVGTEEVCAYFSPSIPRERKRLRAFEDHRAQLAGQLLAHPGVDKISLMAYDPQSDDDPFDLRPVTDPTRGIIFTYTRAEFGAYLDELKDRVKFANEYLDSGDDLEQINKAWEIYKANKPAITLANVAVGVSSVAGDSITTEAKNVPYTLT